MSVASYEKRPDSDTYHIRIQCITCKQMTAFTKRHSMRGGEIPFQVQTISEAKTLL